MPNLRFGERGSSVEKQEAVLPGRLQALGCALLLVVLLAISRPFAEMGIVDDWSYAFTANVLARTGHVVYNGWGAMPMTWLLYWGALFIKLCGFSFLVLRISVLVLSCITVFMMHRFLRCSGLTELNSTLGTLAVMLSPFYFSVTFLFMTDIPGFLALLVCFFAVLRAVQSVADAEVMKWLVIASVSNVILGSVRQTSFLGVLVVVPCAMWLLRRRRKILLQFVPIWLTCVLGVFLIIHWFNVQPYSIHEALFPAGLRLPVIYRTRSTLQSILLYLAPVSIVFLVSLRWRTRLVRVTLLGVLLASCAALPFLIRLGEWNMWTAPFSEESLGHVGMNAMWTMIGKPPSLITMPERAVITVFFWFLVTGLVLYVHLNYRGIYAELQSREEGNSLHTLLVLFGPFSVVYMGLYVTRARPYDRYLIPLAMLLCLLALRILQKNSRSSLWSWAPLATVCAMCFLDVAATHDMFVLYRARLQAAQQLLDKGIPRTMFSAGFEYDGWTEIETAGHIREPRLKEKQPPLAYDPSLDFIHKYYWFANEVPSVTERYVVGFGTTDFSPVPGFTEVHYRTWLHPGTDWTLRIVRGDRVPAKIE